MCTRILDKNKLLIFCTLCYLLLLIVPTLTRPVIRDWTSFMGPYETRRVHDSTKWRFAGTHAADKKMYLSFSSAYHQNISYESFFTQTSIINSKQLFLSSSFMAPHLFRIIDSLFSFMMHPLFWHLALARVARNLTRTRRGPDRCQSSVAGRRQCEWSVDTQLPKPNFWGIARTFIGV